MNFEEKNNIMIEQYLLARGIKSNSVINAFKQVKRHLFVREEDIFFAYNDFPLDIGYNQTISQPYIVALMIEYLNIDKNDKVLEIGTGSGYQTAILSRIAKEVYTLEINEYLAEEAKRKLTELEYKNITFKYGNGYDGFSEYAPYDKIIVSCAANKIPEKLINQLSEEGKMIIPIGSYSWQNLYLIEKNNKQIKTKKLDAVRFVTMKE
jgi:protein-L-isoaspartate(D-aspartate) O-methyltransferase